MATKVDWAWGACLMIPAQVIAAMPGGRLSERFFLYYEDVDWCWQIDKMGLEVWYRPDAQVVHHLSASSTGLGEWDKYMGKILPNEARFILETRGRTYQFFYYLTKALWLSTLRTPAHIAHAVVLLRIARQGRPNKVKIFTKNS